MNTRWTATLEQLAQRSEASVLITIFSSKGSTPRAAGSKMIITAKKNYYSIGGGHLEHKAIAHAQQMLALAETDAQMKSYALGASLGQCCGGHVELLFEPIYPPTQNIAIFGAGHIAKALIPILTQLPCRIHWLDQRFSEFPTKIDPNINVICSDDIDRLIEQTPAQSHILIMTHNHQLDMQLCEAFLKADNFSFLGMIGSKTKQMKFIHRLKHRGFSDDSISKLKCPIGIDPIKGKLPMEIAVSVAAEFIQQYQNGAEQNSPSNIYNLTLHDKRSTNE